MPESYDFQLDDRSAAGISEAIDFLNEAGIPFDRPSKLQVKIGPVNFYSGKGRVHVDGERTIRPGTGLEALKAVLRERGHLPSSAAATARQLGPRG